MRVPRTNPTERFGGPKQRSSLLGESGLPATCWLRGGRDYAVQFALEDIDLQPRAILGAPLGHELFCTFCTMLANEPELVRLAPCNPAIFPSVRFRCHAKNLACLLR